MTRRELFADATSKAQEIADKTGQSAYVLIDSKNQPHAFSRSQAIAKLDSDRWTMFTILDPSVGSVSVVTL
jgi:hypothetical protein